MNQELVKAFEDGTLNIREFDHNKHIYIAWYYLCRMGLPEALNTYVKYLCVLLNNNGLLRKFDLAITTLYFNRIKDAMTLNPTNTFEEFLTLADLE